MENKEQPTPDKETSPRESGRKTAKKATIVIVSKAVSKVVAALSAVVLARVLTKDAFGLLQFILTAYLTVSTLSQLGLPESVFYFFERVTKQSRKDFTLLLARLLFLLGLGGSVILVALTFVAPYWGFPVQWYFLPLIFLAVIDLPCSLTPNVLLALDRAKQAAWFNLINSSLLFCAMVVPVLLGLPISAIVVALVGYGLVRLLVSSGFFYRNFGHPGGELPDGMVRTVFNYSVPLALANILWTLNRYIDKFVVAAFMSVEVYAEYAIATYEIPFIPTIAYSVATVMMPQFVGAHMRGDTTELLRLWFQSIRKVSLIVLPLMVLFLVVADEFIVLAFSDRYAGAALPFRIYTLILFQRVTSYGSVLKAVGNTRAVTRHAIYVVCLNIALSIPLIMVMGIAGPPTATLIASVVTWFYLLFKIKESVNVAFKDVFPFSSYLKTLAVAFAAGGAVYFLSQAFAGPVALVLTGKILAFFLAYFALALTTGICTREDLLFIASLVGVKSRKTR